MCIWVAHLLPMLGVHRLCHRWGHALSLPAWQAKYGALSRGDASVFMRFPPSTYREKACADAMLWLWVLSLLGCRRCQERWCCALWCARCALAIVHAHAINSPGLQAVPALWMRVELSTNGKWL